jgi:hypothetical protein
MRFTLSRFRLFRASRLFRSASVDFGIVPSKRICNGRQRAFFRVPSRENALLKSIVAGFSIIHRLTSRLQLFRALEREERRVARLNGLKLSIAKASPVFVRSDLRNAMLRIEPKISFASRVFVSYPSAPLRVAKRRAGKPSRHEAHDS